MPPKSSKTLKSKETAKPAKDGDERAQLAEVIDSLREYAASTAVAQLIYVMLRTLWHVMVPQWLGVQPFVPLAAQVLAAGALLFLVFRAGGGFGPPSQERPWVLILYAILSVGILGKCTTDCYVYQFAPAMWAHFRPGKPWGMPTLLAARLAPTLGIAAQHIHGVIRFFELSGDAFFLLSMFRGIWTGMALILARRKQKKLAQQKKD